MHRVESQNFTKNITGNESAALCFPVYSLAVRVEWDLRYVTHRQSSFPGVSCLTAVEGGGEWCGI